jgi:arylsulfatase A-like enzyme
MPAAPSRHERAVTLATLGFAVRDVDAYSTCAMRFRVLVCVLLLVGSAAAEARHPNVIVVVAEALRPDRLGRRDMDGPLMPFLGSLAGRGYVFTHAYAAASCTPASVASLFTGRDPGRHGVGCRGGALADDVTTLAAVLRARGFATGVFTAAPLFAGADAGADRYRHVKHAMPVPADAAFVGSDALRWLGERKDAGAPVFLYLHYVDVLAPYAPPPAYVQRVSGILDQRREQELFDMVRRANQLYRESPQRLPTPPEVADLTTVYDAAAKGLDHQLRSLFQLLERQHLLDDAIVLVTAAQGEDFAEHGTLGHGRTLWETTTRVPMVLLVPRSSARVDVDEPVSLVDVAPTLLELLGVPGIGRAEGRSRVAALRRAEHPWAWETLRWRLGRWWTGPEDAAYSEIPDDGGAPIHRRALVQGTAKVIVARDGTRAYFDLAADPGETNPRALAPPARERLERGLAARR